LKIKIDLEDTPIAVNKYAQQAKTSLQKLETKSFEVSPKTPSEVGLESSSVYPSIRDLKTNFGKHRNQVMDYRSEENIGSQTLNERENELQLSK
jgi:hypothetical protein